MDVSKTLPEGQEIPFSQPHQYKGKLQPETEPQAKTSDPRMDGVRDL